MLPRIYVRSLACDAYMPSALMRRETLPNRYIVAHAPVKPVPSCETRRMQNRKAANLCIYRRLKHEYHGHIVTYVRYTELVCAQTKIAALKLCSTEGT